jgi:hypothetical protein
MGENKSNFFSFLLGAVIFNKGLPLLWHLVYWLVIIGVFIFHR